MPRLFRQSPLNAIWEGSGNVIALDILRALSREPESLKAVEAELETALGVNDIYDRHCASLADFTESGALHEGSARAFAQAMALALQAAALKQTAPDFVFHGFCAQRLSSGRRGFLYGDVDSSVDQDAIIERAMPG